MSAAQILGDVVDFAARSEENHNFHFQQGLRSWQGRAGSYQWWRETPQKRAWDSQSPLSQFCVLEVRLLLARPSLPGILLFCLAASALTLPNHDAAFQSQTLLGASPPWGSQPTAAPRANTRVCACTHTHMHTHMPRHTGGTHS